MMTGTIALADASFGLEVNGRPLGDGSMNRITGLRLERALDTPAALSVRFTSSGPDSAGLPGPGNTLILTNGGATLFSGLVARIDTESGPEGQFVSITAFDRLAELQIKQTRGVEVVNSIHGFVRRLAAGADLGFTAHCADFSAGRHLQRFGDDLAFLLATLHRYGLSVICKNDDLHLLAPGEAAPSPVDIAGEIIHIRRSEEPRLAGNVIISGWSAADDHPLSARPALAGGLYGPAGVPFRADEPVERLRTAESLRRNRAAAWMEAEISGLFDVWPGDALVVPGGGSPDSLTRVELSADAAGGLRTSLSSCPLSQWPISPTAVLTGTVDQIGDPQSEGRVRVALHGYDGALTGWLPVVAPGGGPATGLAVPLRIGDPALVAAPQGDPELGIVLGGLLRAGGPQKDLVSGDTRTGMTWRGEGLSVTLDEAQGQISLQLDGGTALKLTEDRITLTAAHGFDLNCGGRVRIRGSRIDFVEA